MWRHEPERTGILATALVVLLVAGCSKVSTVAPSSPVPRPGTPVQWGPCQVGQSVGPRVPPDAECGKLSVPVDYAKPDGDVAQLAMIRFTATGDKIGSLVINPGGPGESGVEAAASIVGDAAAVGARSASTWSGSTRAGSRSSTPAVWCNSDADNDRLRADPQVDYTPAGRRAHRERDQGSSCSAASTRWARSSWPTSARPTSSRISTRMRAAVGDEKLTYLGYSYGTRIGGGYAEAVPGEGSGDDPRRRRRPQRRPDRGRHPPGRGLPEGVRRLRRRLRQGPELSAGHRPRQGRRRLQAAWSTRWWTSPPRPAIRAACATATRSSARSCRCTRRTSGATSPRV